MKKLVLISCVSKKGKQKAKARDLYESPLFKNSLSYAESLNPDKIFILSALHHLLDLDTEIEPYNVTLAQVSKSKRDNDQELKVLTKEEKIRWGEEVIEQLKKVSNLKDDKFIILAGKSYIEPIREKLENIEEPLKGLTQGKRLSFLIKNTKR